MTKEEQHLCIRYDHTPCFMRTLVISILITIIGVFVAAGGSYLLDWVTIRQFKGALILAAATIIWHIGFSGGIFLYMFYTRQFTYENCRAYMLTITSISSVIMWGLPLLVLILPESKHLQ